VNVGAKGSAVNSAFLVQLRKMLSTDFRGSTRMVNLLEDVTLSRIQGSGRVAESASGDGFRRTGKRIVHRGCTGNAETVISGQWSVVSDQ
jgi:hypothetical protein